VMEPVFLYGFIIPRVRTHFCMKFGIQFLCGSNLNITALACDYAVLVFLFFVVPNKKLTVTDLILLTS